MNNSENRIKRRRLVVSLTFLLAIALIITFSLIANENVLAKKMKKDLGVNISMGNDSDMLTAIEKFGVSNY